MNGVWHIWADGSCMHGLHNVPKGMGGWGGWAAIVEHGSDGYNLRGRTPDTTNVRMELRAAIEGLRSIPEGERVILHTDATTIVNVFWAWRDGNLAYYNGLDARFWLELDAEFDKRTVGVHLLLRNERDPIHAIAHAIAGAEARGGLRNMPVNASPFDSDEIREKRQRYLRRLNSTV